MCQANIASHRFFFVMFCFAQYSVIVELETDVILGENIFPPKI